MAIAFLILLALVASVATLIWLGWRHVAAHLRKNPEAARLLAEHVIAPLLTGEKESKPETKAEPEPKKIKATLV